MFRTAQALVETSNPPVALEDGKSYRITFTATVKDQPALYIFDTDEVLAGGSEGTIHPTTKLSESQEADEKRQAASAPSSPLVTKYIRRFHSADRIRLEAHLNREYFPCASPIFSGSSAFIVMKKLPGKPLGYDTAPEFLNIPQLPYYWRIKIAYLMAQQINQLHHKRQVRNTPVLHCDIKSSNFMIDVVKNATGEVISISVQLTDFGLAKTLASDDPSATYPQSDLCGTYLHLAPETLTTPHRYGIKTDIFALSAVIGQVLDAKDLFEDRLPKTDDCNAKHGAYVALKSKPQTDSNRRVTTAFKAQLEASQKKLAATQFDFTMLFSSCPLPADFPGNAKHLTQVFLNRMQHVTYDKRPSSDEVVDFFGGLNKLCDLHRNQLNNKVEIAKTVHALNLLVLAEAISQLKDYHKKKDELVKQLGYESYEEGAHWYSYTNGLKRDAAACLIACISSPQNYHLLFQKENQKHLKALENGKLHAIVHPILKSLKALPQNFSHGHSLLFTASSTNAANPGRTLCAESMRYGRTLMRL